MFNEFSTNLHVFCCSVCKQLMGTERLADYLYLAGRILGQSGRGGTNGRTLALTLPSCRWQLPGSDS